MQSSLEFPIRFSKAAYAYGDRSDGGTHGIVLTKPHVVELILDLAGYTSDTDLGQRRLLEPSCGHGAFLIPAVERLLASALKHGRELGGLGRALLSFDIDDAHVAQTRAAIVDVLEKHAVDVSRARELARLWVQGGDFLLEPLTQDFDFVVGNTSVRIGVASGNDSIYIVPSDLDVEPDRLVPLVMRDDIDGGAVKNGRRCVINTFETKGIIDLENYPRLQRYFSEHTNAIKRRHVAQKNKEGWFRTIDRVYPELVSKPKLLIPDIAGANEVVFEAGHYYPHHNLYFVISDVWDMEVLGGLLSSRVALFFVWSYAVKMRGGYLRFQAQYLRRIRVPRPDSLSADLQHRIKSAFRARDFVGLDLLAREAYELSEVPTFDFVDTRK